jgi:hypothetical protein
LWLRLWLLKLWLRLWLLKLRLRLWLLKLRLRLWLLKLWLRLWLLIPRLCSLDLWLCSLDLRFLLLDLWRWSGLILLLLLFVRGGPNDHRDHHQNQKCKPLPRDIMTSFA